MTNVDLGKVLGERLCRLRIREGWNQRELAEKLNVSKGTISNYENGLRTMGSDEINRASDLFEVSLDYLYGRSDDDSKEAYLASKKSKANKKPFVTNIEVIGSGVDKAAYTNHNVADISEEQADKIANKIFEIMQMRDDKIIDQATYEKLLKKLTT